MQENQAAPEATVQDHTTSEEQASVPLEEWLSSLTMDDLTYNSEFVFTRLRTEAPLAWIPVMGAWMATSWDVCQAIANDAETFHGGTSPIHERVFGSPHILGAEGDVHADLRLAIGAPVSPRAFRGQIEERVRPIARSYIDQLRQGAKAELMADYFEPISVRSVADAYGFHDVDATTLRRWFHGLASGTVNAAIEPDGTFSNPEGFDAADVARSEIYEYLTRVDERNNGTAKHPITDLLEAGRSPENPRSIEELLPSLLVVLLGGLQEPGHACGNTFLGLMSNDEQLRRVIANPSLLPKAIVEGLRWLSPLYSGASRIPSRDVHFAGQELHKGDTVWLTYGSANHDIKEFDAPDKFDIDRASHAHLAFGLGRHSCAGSAFSPQIVRVALEELFSAFPEIRLDPEAEVNITGWMFRGAAEIHAVLGKESNVEISATSSPKGCPAGMS